MLQSKSVASKNDENVVPKTHNVKTVTTETYKFVSVTSHSTTTTSTIAAAAAAAATNKVVQITDENRPPQRDEVDHVTSANCSFSGIR